MNGIPKGETTTTDGNNSGALRHSLNVGREQNGNDEHGEFMQAGL